MQDHRSAEQLIEAMDGQHRLDCSVQRELFGLIARVDRLELWRDSGARDMAHWLWMRYGISEWKARRWIAASHALEYLPLIAEAFSSGELGIDKVVELTRFATPATEATLIPWAQRVSSGAIRAQGDLAVRRSEEETLEVEQSRFLSWWTCDEGRRFGLEAELPAAQGAVVARALDRLADEVPVLPGEEGRGSVQARRADALVALASARIGSDGDPDRATVVVHTTVEALVDAEGGSQIESGGVISAQTARRLGCTARVQAVVEDSSGRLIHLGRMRRDPPPWDAPPAPVPGPGVHLPGVRVPPVHPGPPHQVVGEWWPDRPGQPGDDLLVPPPPGP